MWERNKDSDKDIAHTATMVDCAVIMDDATCRSMLVSTLMIYEDFVATGDAIFDKVVSAGDDLGLDRDNFH